MLMTHPALPHFVQSDVLKNDNLRAVVMLTMAVFFIIKLSTGNKHSVEKKKFLSLSQYMHSLHSVGGYTYTMFVSHLFMNVVFINMCIHDWYPISPELFNYKLRAAEPQPCLSQFK